MSRTAGPELAARTAPNLAILRRGMTLVGLVLLVAGCAPNPRMLSPNERVSIDRKYMEYPTGFTLQPYIRGLTGPTSLGWDKDGSLLIAEGGGDADDTRIVGFKPGGEFFTLFPQGRKVPFNIVRTGFQMYAPIGGMLVYQDKIYVSHRDSSGMGVITALDHQGHNTTIVAGLPAQGDYSVTDLAIDPRVGRLLFGVGSTTNSGVVGLDNWQWVHDQPTVHDLPWGRLHLRGYRFDSPNPFSGLFGPADKAVTAPFQPFDVGNETEVDGHEKPGAAIYSCSPRGGDLRVEAHGIRYPRGLAFNGYWFYFTNNGMELRGTRPVKNDPDAFLRLIPGGTWYGWPDFTADLQPVYIDQFQPPIDMIARTGYKRVLFVIDQQASNLDPKGVQLLEPNRDTLLKAVFSPLAGASKLDFVPATGPFRQFRGKAIIALEGERAPFATSGRPIIGPLGHKVVMVDTDTKQVKDFVRNTGTGPASVIDPKNSNLLERPIDAKFGPDGALYILDAGRMQMKDGREHYEKGTGQIFRVVPVKQ